MRGHLAFPAPTVSLLLSQDVGETDGSVRSYLLFYPFSYPSVQWGDELGECGNKAEAGIGIKAKKRLKTPMPHPASAVAAYLRRLSGTYSRSVGPVYSALGRMSLLFSYCSRMCAVQPAMRLKAKMGVKNSSGMPMA